MPTIETNYYAAWIGKQSAKGTPNTTPSRRLQQQGGEVAFVRDDGSEEVSDLTKYGDTEDWVNSNLGRGDLALHATPTELAYVLWLMHGAEAYSAISAVSGPPAIPAMARHRFTPTSTIGYYSTIFQRVGSSVGPRRHQSNDCVCTKVQIEASTAAKMMRFTPSFISLDPSIPYAADPAAAMPSDRPFLFTDLSQVGSTPAASIDGSLVVDGSTFRGVTQFSLTIDDAWEPIFGDSTTPYDFQQGNAGVQVGATIYFDAAGLAQWNTLVYGTASPTAGTRPIKAVPPLGSFTATVRQRTAAGAHAGREVVATVPGVKWEIPPAPQPSSGGGAAEIALSGMMRPVSGQPAYTVDVLTDSAIVAFTT